MNRWRYISLLMVMVLALSSWVPAGVVRAEDTAGSIASLQWSVSANEKVLLGGGTKTISVWAVDASSIKKEVTAEALWSSSNPKVAEITAGVITPKAAGTVKITALYGGKQVVKSVTVAPGVKSITLSPGGSFTLFSGQEAQVAAAALGLTGDKKDVTANAVWTSSNPAVVGVDKGKLTAAGPGKAAVTASYLGKAVKLTIIVYAVPDKLTSSRSSLTLTTGDKLTLPSIYVTDASGKKINFSSETVWTVGDSSVLKLVNKQLTALKAGNTMLQANLAGRTLDIPVSVNMKIKALKSATTGYVMTAGQSAALPPVQALLADGQAIDVSSKVIWTGSAAGIALQDGKIHAVKAGNYTIKAMHLNKSLKIPVRVEPVVQELKVSSSSVSLNLKGSTAMKVTAVYTDGTKADVTSRMIWTSSNPSAAVLKGNSLKAAGIGESTLTGTYQNQNISVQVKVVPKLIKLEANVKSVSLTSGKSQQITVNAVYDTGEKKNVTSSVQWVSSKPAAAVVKEGAVTGAAKGTTVVKAMLGTNYVTIPVKVS
ncbi:tenascin [Paenibacillus lacisoli]|nr:tenascin [Paenibacillus sp. JX-17]